MLSLLIVTLATSSAFAAHPLEAKIKKSGIPLGELSLYIAREGAKPETVVDINGDVKKIPASISKVATTSAVLDAFPPGSTFKTTLWTEGAPDAKGVIKGAVYLKGGGDPSFVSENMWFLVNAFKRTGIKTIEGDIVVDDSLFDLVRFDESREDVRVDRAYDAPVGAMSFNWNSINIFVRPGGSGEAGSVFLDPENEYTVLVNQTKTTKGVTNTLEARREKSGDESREKFSVSGHIGADKSEVVIFKNISKPDLWAGANLRSFLAQRGITVSGGVRAGKTPPGAIQQAESSSKNVEQIIADMNKFSNNFVAEMLTKNLSAKSGAQGNLKNGVELIQRHLLDLGLKKDDFVFVNPSGLTRDNRFSAKSLWKVVHHLHSDFRIQPEFFASLPIAGIDGTLKKRMKGSAAERWVRAKTGMLNGVTALAGYAGKEDGTVYSFVFIHNGSRDESRIRALYDEWLISLLKAKD